MGVRLPLIIAAGATAIWLLFLAWLTLHVQQCQPLLPYVRFAERFLSCLKPNELGDYVAGAFAPVAFLWFAATVFMQSRELADQRTELREARVLAKAQSDAAAAQAEEAAAQTKLLLSAHEAGEKARSEAYAREEFEAFRQEASIGELREVSVAMLGSIQKFSIEENISQAHGSFEAVVLARQAFEKAVHAARVHKGAAQYHPIIASWADRFEKIIEFSQDMSPAMQLRIADLDLPQLVRWMREFKHS